MNLNDTVKINTMNINSKRSSTPPKVIFSSVNNPNTKLNEREFPRFDEAGKLNCPPAPPRPPYEMRICSCTQTYIIKLITNSENEPPTKCARCSKLT
jgi:hypothetical protein